MNNKGFGTVYILVFAIFAILAIFVFYSFVSNFFIGMSKTHAPNYNNEYSVYYNIENNDNKLLLSNNISKYNYLESKVEMAAEKYYKDHNIYVSEYSPTYIKISTLKNNAYISTVSDVNDNTVICSGYAELNNKNGNIIYNAFIKCGANYTSSGYNVYLDN